MTIRCFFGRHDDLLARDGPRLFLRCQTCGRATPGLAPGPEVAKPKRPPLLERVGRVLAPVPFLLGLFAVPANAQRVWTNEDLRRPVAQWQKPPLTPQEAADVLRPHQTVVHVCYDCEGPRVVVFGSSPSLGPWDDAARMGPNWNRPPEWYLDNLVELTYPWRETFASRPYAPFPRFLDTRPPSPFVWLPR